MLRFLPILIVFLSLTIESVAQTEITVMSYNILNFPTSSLSGREDTLKKIIDYVQPDLFLIQELKNEQGLEDIVNSSFTGVEGNFVSATYLSQQSNPNSSWPLQQAMVYNTNVFGLAYESYVPTEYRDVNYYKLYLKDIELTNGADTSFLHVFVTHLKAGNDADEEVIRTEMVQAFLEYLPNIPEDEPCMIGGDFNLYYSDEVAYQLLISPDNPIVFEDPIDAPGNWTQSSYPFKHVLTQSTRTSQIFNDGASGGLDDRFDFVLLSSNIMDGSSTFQYVEDTYRALGNNGNCYNGNITECAGDNEVDDEMLSSLYYMSDHLPVILNLSTDISLSLNESDEESYFSVYLVGSNLSIQGNNMPTQKRQLKIYDSTGKIVLQNDNLISGNNRLTIDLSGFSNGLYIVELVGKNLSRQTQKIILSQN